MGGDGLALTQSVHQSLIESLNEIKIKQYNLVKGLVLEVLLCYVFFCFFFFFFFFEKNVK